MNYDVLIIGSGPGGYVCALRCAHYGLKVGLVERADLGGVCLNVGCIPSKAMITSSEFFHQAKNKYSSMGISFDGIDFDFKKTESWKSSICKKMSDGVKFLLQSKKVDVIQGEAFFKDQKTLEVRSQNQTKTYQAKNFVVATGSKAISLPDFPWKKDLILSSTEALNLQKLPKKVLVIGAGYIGLEIGGYLSRFGVDVHILEPQKKLLNNFIDSDLSLVVQKQMEKQGVKFLFNTKALSYKEKSGSLEVSIQKDGVDQKIEVEKIILTVGRRALSDECGLSEIGVHLDENSYVKVDHQRKTSVKGIYAIGDVCGQPCLAHKASYEALLVSDVIYGKNRSYDIKSVPSVIFTDPEIASVGLTEENCKKKNVEVLVGKFPFAANGRASSLMKEEGFVKVIAEKKTHQIAGVHIVGAEASQLISEACLALEMGARLEDITSIIHPHPSLSEAFAEACEVALGHPLHIVHR